jgi:carboxypeptidase family protein
VLHGDLLIDDATTGVGDGYAIDFERTLLNPHLTIHAGTVTGRVTDASNGKPIEGATVSAAGTVQATTAANGTFTLPGVAAGLAVLTATAPTHIHKTSPVDIVEASTKTLNFSLPPGTDTFSIPTQSTTSTSSKSSAPGAPSGHTRSSFTRSLVAISDISTKGKDLARSAIVAVIFLLLVAFPAELFNSTLDEHYEDVKAWFGPLGRVADSAGRIAKTLPSWVGFAIFAFVGALIGCLLDPKIALDQASVALFAGLLVSFVAITLCFGTIERRYMRRSHGDAGRLQVLPGTLVVAAVSVLVSRLAGYQPGYLYGIIAGFVFAHELRRNEEGRISATASLVLLGGSIVAWIIWTPIGHMAAHANPNIVTLLLDSILAAMFIAGIQSLVFGLLPLRFLEGESIFEWRRLAWLAIYAITLFAFIHVLLHPGVAYDQSHSGHAFAVSIVLFAAFGALSIAFWAYFRARDKKAASVHHHTPVVDTGTQG